MKKNIAPDVIISQKKAKLLSLKKTLCVSNYFSMGNFTKNRSWKQKSIELFFTDMVSLITKILPEFSCCQNSKFDFSGWFRKLINTKKNIVNFGIGKIMLWTAQIPSMCSSPNIIVNKKKSKSKNQFTKTIRSKTNKYQKRKKIETLYRRRFWKKQKNNIITIIHQCYKIKHLSRHLRKLKNPLVEKLSSMSHPPNKKYTLGINIFYDM